MTSTMALSTTTSSKMFQPLPFEMKNFARSTQMRRPTSTMKRRQKRVARIPKRRSPRRTSASEDFDTAEEAVRSVSQKMKMAFKMMTRAFACLYCWLPTRRLRVDSSAAITASFRFDRGEKTSVLFVCVLSIMASRLRLLELSSSSSPSPPRVQLDVGGEEFCETARAVLGVQGSLHDFAPLPPSPLPIILAFNTFVPPD
mmetsp:Transcript_8513/g.18132  ORF Transcript_8513/g.18132 Transcript_8513/m.18132 type:complete len:200 (+) Transcript_8513:1010-1609(+)